MKTNEKKSFKVSKIERETFVPVIPAPRGEIVGTQETEDAIDFIIGLENAVKLARADGKIDWQDAPLIFALTPNLLKAIQGGENIPIELGDLSQGEIDYLSAKYGERIANPNYRRALYGLAILADAIVDEVKSRNEQKIASKRL